MNLDFDPIVDAVGAIRSRGHVVEPDEEFEHWRINGGDWLPPPDQLRFEIADRTQK